MHQQISLCRWCGLLACALALLGGCAAQPLVLSQNSSALPMSAELGGLPYFPQLDDQCGPASLATVLGHSGIHTTPEALKPAVYLPGRGGSLALELVAKARQHQRLVYRLQPDIEHLLRELAAGNPVLVLQNLRFDWWPQWHFAVAIGYDLQAQNILLRSGSHRRYAVGIGLFVRTWRRAGRWAVLVTRPEQLPATAAPTATIRAAADLEELGLLDAAESAYLAALRLWPEQPLALMGLGNIAYSRARFSHAETWYRHVIEAADSGGLLRATAWNNRAYALLHSSRRDDALVAAQCAVQLRPDYPAFRDSLQELRLLVAEKKGPLNERPYALEDCGNDD